VISDELKFHEDYLLVMENGLLNEAFLEALHDLSPEQLEHLMHILEDRRARREPT
jgi:hypothetical protein